MILLLITALIWGVAFVAQSVGMEYIQPFTFTCIRCILGGVVLIPCIWILDKVNPQVKRNDKDMLIGGVLCGLCLFVASNLQQFGIQYTSVGKAGFITACYIVIVPIAGIFLGKKSRIRIWGAVALALVGLYLLCITDSFSIEGGDILILISAFVFAAHILIIDHFSPRVNGVKMACVQFFVCGILSGIMMLIFEEPSMTGIMAAKIPLLYAGVLACGVAYTFQILGQKNVNPAVASLVLSLEACISVLAGWIILGQRLTAKELIGCAVMFAAIILAQLPERKRKMLFR